MKFGKLTALSILSLSFVFNSCVNDDVYAENTYVGYDIVMSSAQEVPAVTTPSTATGIINVSYSKLSKTLSYKLTFSGLTGNATAAHIHGTGEVGVAAPILQTFGSFPAAKSGTYSGTLFFDGKKINETDLLAGKYYINIHTAANAGGEIRGQLVLGQK